MSIFGLITLPTSRAYETHTRPRLNLAGCMLTVTVYPFALIVLDVLTGGPGKAMGGIIGLLAGHLW